MRHWKTVLIAGSILLVQTQTVQAQQVRFTGEKCPLPIAATAEGETEITKVGSIHVLGRTSEEQVAVLLKEQVGYVSVQAFEELAPKLDLDTLPMASSVEVYQNGSSGDGVQKLQEQLAALGYLEGTADGIYGSGTAGAVSRFQEACALEQTGVADAVTQWALEEEADGKDQETLVLEYPAVYTVEEKFGAISGAVSADLEQFLSSSWRFSYDVYRQEGSITSGLSLGHLQEEGADIDRISISAFAELSVVKNNQDQTDLIPAIQVESQGAYRPYVQSVFLRSGQQVCELPLTGTKGQLESVDIKEISTVSITSEAAEFLKGLDDSAELIVMAAGRNQDYELEFDGDLAEVKDFVETCETAGVAFAEE
jgi:peptidoglycan hydrolase-like protein with peptidoglycan-binding domain